MLGSACPQVEGARGDGVRGAQVEQDAGCARAVALAVERLGDHRGGRSGGHQPHVRSHVTVACNDLVVLCDHGAAATKQREAHRWVCDLMSEALAEFARGSFAGLYTAPTSMARGKVGVVDLNRACNSSPPSPPRPNTSGLLARCEPHSGGRNYGPPVHPNMA